MAEPLPTITCPCGFTASGLDEGANLQALSNHTCPNRPGTSWHESLFSFEGFMVVCALAGAAWAVAGIAGAVR